MREYEGRVAGLQVSRGGVPKHSIDDGEVGVEGFINDRQNDRKAHGGPMRALCLYGLEVEQQLAGDGHNIAPGHLGENVTTEGIDWSLVKPGARLLLGNEVECEVTAYAEPCWKNSHWFRDGDISRILQEKHPGFSRVYARVLKPGPLAVGDTVTLQLEDAAERVQRQMPRTFRWSPPD